MLKKIPLFLLLLSFFVTLRAQKLTENKAYSQFNYIFRLDSAQTRKVYMGAKLDSAMFLTHLVDSFNRDSIYKYDRLPWGLYLTVSVNGALVNYKTYHNRPFLIETWGTNRRNFITLKDKQYQIIKDAKVSLLNDTICRFVSGMGSYLLPEIKPARLVKIEYKGQYDYIYINTQYAANAKINNQYPDNSYTTIAPGYLVFNQPRFKHYDTLKWKAFLLQDNGSSYTERLKLYLSVDYKEKFIGYIKPKTPGAYFSAFEIADTFLPDRQYALLIKNTRNELIKSNTFMVENYELKAYKYNLVSPKQNCITGDEVGLTVSALDANNLPVMDVSITIGLRITGISQYLTDRQFIPDAWTQNYFKSEISADISGYTRFTFPDSLFRHFNASYEVLITIRDLDNNVREFRTNFQYTNNNTDYGLGYVQDSLKVKYFYKTISANTDLILETQTGNTISKKAITTPYSEPINFLASLYRLYKGDSLLASYIPHTNYISQVYFDGRRTGDSIHIDLVNPLNLPVYYEVYHNTTKISEGSGTSFHLHAAAPGMASYHIVWGHNYLGQLIGSFKVRSFHLAEKKLNVMMNQPAEIYPGQTIDLAIKVTDQFNHPVNNVNLTAYSVNTQFDNIPAPDVPYMGLTRGGYPLEYCYPIAFTPSYSTYFNLSKYHFTVLNLFRNDYYRLFYTTGGIGKIEMPIRRQKAELSAYVIKQQQLQNIIYIKVDDQLVYHQYFLAPKAFSFPVSNGAHSIAIRTFDRLLTYQNLIVKDSFKYTLGFNLDSIAYKQDTMLCLPGKLKAYERSEFLDNALFISIKTTGDTFTIYQRKQLKTFSHGRYNVYSNGLSSLRIENDNYLCVGPVNQDEIHFKLYSQYEHQFNFERGFAYLLYANEVKPIQIISDLRQYGLLSNVITNTEIYNLNSFDKLWYSPQYDTVPKAKSEDLSNTAYTKTERERPTIEQKSYQPENSSNLSNGKIAFVWPQKPFDFRNAWLIHREDNKMSVINFQQRDLLPLYKTGFYDLLLFTDTSFWLIDNLYLQIGGRTTLFLQPEKFKPLDYAAIYPYEKIISELTKLPFNDFTDTPVIIKPYILEKKQYKSLKSKISGRVMDAKFNTPVDYANIYAEIDGYFKAGATTNADGRFELNNLPAGNYMLKIRTDAYRYQIIYNLKIESGKELVIKINLLHHDDAVYYNEAGEVVMNEPSPMAEYVEGNYAGTDKDGKYYELNAQKKSLNSNTSVQWSYGDNNASVAGAATYNYGLTGRGSRTDATAYFIDGVRTTGSEGALYQERKKGINEFPTEEAMQNKLDAMANIAQANRVRDKFRDYGYWVPNLITGKDGMAYCRVTFPDNITSWQTFVPAMNQKFQSGLKSMVTLSYKPLVAQMAVPYFLTEGDVIYLKGKVINYTGSGKSINLQFLINDSLIKNRDFILDKYMADSLLLNAAKGQDSVSTTFAMKLGNGYTDGEKRRIPIQPNSINISRSRNIYLDNDTSITLFVPENVKSARLLVHNSEVERLLSEIEVLKNYSYGCVEQTTSKLRALLTEKAIRQTLNLPFNDDKMVRKMIHRLSSLRGDNGLWSWWGNGDEDDWLSAYVMRTLNEARLAGYPNNAYIKGANYLEKKLKTMTAENQLYTLNMLYDMNRDVAYDTILKHIDPDQMNVNSKLLYTRLMQKRGKAYQIKDVTQHLQYSNYGGIFFGINSYNYKNDLSSSTLLAYDILSNNDTGKEYLPYIKEFFYSSGYPRHTFALAEMINSGATEAIKKNKKGNAITGDIMVNDFHLKADDFPYKHNLKPGDSITLRHKGAEAYATLVTSRAETNPQPNNANFTIRTKLGEQYNNITLQPGVPVTMDIEIESYKSFENVMLEIPVPAGFSYYKKPPAGGIETYREYYYDKTAIFCTSLSAGKYHFSIELIPKYSGNLNLPPAKVELMYYPEIFNNEIPKTIIVK